jgi:formiminotetrahydrofolate cyclodeaminase
VTEGPTRFRDLTLAAFVDRLASSAPVPGGGSASAITGSLAAALVRMVVALSLDRPKYAAYEATQRRADGVAERALERLLSLADEDAASYARLAAAFRMPKATPDEEEARHTAIRVAARDAALSPLAVMRECWDVLAVSEAIAGRSNVNASSDVATAASLAEAGARGAASNVLINLPLTGDDQFEAETTAEVVRTLEAVDDVATQARFAAARSELRDPEPAT